MKFKPEDFSNACVRILKMKHGLYPAQTWGIEEAVSEAANSILQAHLATLPKLYGSSKDGPGQAWFTYKVTPNFDRQAVLWGITEIEKKECEEHEPLEYERNIWGATYKNYKCSKCGVKLKAKWEKV